MPVEEGLIALEIEWNNRDPFFYRDLENFQRLHAEGAISVGVLLTRGKSLQFALGDLILAWARFRGIMTFDDLAAHNIIPAERQRNMVAKAKGSFAENWSKRFAADKFGVATTHWDKLQERVSRGVGNPCPLLLVGIPVNSVRQDPL